MVERHRFEEFLAFFDHAEGGIKRGTDVHVILDNVSSQKSAMVNEWLKCRPRWTLHFSPTSASWTNAVEGSLSKLPWRSLKHAILNLLYERIAAIVGFIEHHNANGTSPVRGSRKPEDPVEAWKKGHQKLQEMVSCKRIRPIGYPLNCSIWNDTIPFELRPKHSFSP